MPKPTNIRNLTGLGGAPAGGAKSTFKITPIMPDEAKDAKDKKKDGESIAARKLDLGHNLSAKAAKAQGGGSGSAGRPKV